MKSKLFELSIRVYLFLLIGSLSTTLVFGRNGFGFIVLKYLGIFTLGLISLMAILLIALFIIEGVVNLLNSKNETKHRPVTNNIENKFSKQPQEESLHIDSEDTYLKNQKIIIEKEKSAIRLLEEELLHRLQIKDLSLLEKISFNYPNEGNNQVTYIRFIDNQWQINYKERGRDDVLHLFKDKQEILDWLYNKAVTENKELDLVKRSEQSVVPEVGVNKFIELTQKELHRVNIEMQGGLELIGWLTELPDILTEDGIINALKESVNILQFQNKYPIGEYLNNEQAAYALGSVFGDSICSKYGWAWKHKEVEGDKVYVVVSPNGKYCCHVHGYIYQLLTDKSKNTVKLLFNLLSKETELPVSSPDSFLVLN